MKRNYLALCLLVILTLLPAALLSADEGQGLGLGFSVGDRHGDLSLGLEMESPSLVQGHMGFRLAAEWLLVEGSKAGSTTMHPYYLARLGLVINASNTPLQRLYGEFGALVIQAPGLATLDPCLGIYGLFGFDFRFGPGSPGSYFIELGSSGSFGAVDSGLDNSPTLATGFSARAGFRWRFR
jgi:hypothetical protein